MKHGDRGGPGFQLQPRHPAVDGATAGGDAANRKRMVVALSFAYGTSMLTDRQTIMQLLPTMVKDLNLDPEDGGKLLSLGASVYMLCKPAGQVISDSAEARGMLVLSLVMSGVVFVAMGSSNALWQIQLCFAALHLAQGAVSPSWLAIVGRAFAPNERGTPLSIVNGAGNAVSAFIPLLVATTLRLSGGQWRTVLLSQGVVSALFGVVLRFSLSPWPPSDSSFSARPGKRAAVAPAVRKSARSEKDPVAGGLARAAAALLGVARRGDIQLLGLSALALYFVRFGVQAWLASYLARGTTGEAGAAAAAFLFWWQAGGVLGSLAAGPAADALPDGGRAPLLAACAAALAGGLGALPLLDGAAAPAALAGVGALCGACVFGLKTLVTLCTRERVPPDQGGRADAIVNLLAELGGVTAGLPLIRLVRRLSWDAYVPALQCGALVIVGAGLRLYLRPASATPKKTG